ncbi:MAG: hypothetical protein WAZ19_08030 [Anaerolineae bacterium]
MSDLAAPAERTFRVQPGFQFFYSLPVLLTVAALGDLWLNPGPGKGWLVLFMLFLAAITLPRGWSKVTLRDHLLTVQMRPYGTRQVDLRGLTGLETSSHIGHALVLRYHPLDAAGQLDRTREAFLGLPPLQDQNELAETLEQALHSAPAA